jgi:hypothetical protein
MPLRRHASATPSGPKKPRAVASQQPNPTTAPLAIATWQPTGRPENATSHSLDQPDPNVARTHSTTACFSSGRAGRTSIPATVGVAGSAYSFTRKSDIPSTLAGRALF